MNQREQHSLVVIEGRATYERIVQYIREVEPTEAIRQVQNFLKIYPEFAQAHNDLAVLFYQYGNGMKALAHYEKAHKLEPANITYRKNLADFYFVELEWADDAIQTYLDILKDNPFDIETLNALGTISSAIGRSEQARQYYVRTLQLDSINSQARNALQQLDGQLPPGQITGSSQRSISMLPQSESATPYQFVARNPEDIHRQALESATSSNNVEARRILENLIKLHPSYSAAYNDLAIICQQAGDLTEARRRQLEAYQLQPDSPVFQKNLADLLYIAFGETEEALKLYVKSLESNPQDIEALKAISQICLDSGMLDDARSFLESIIRIEPGNNDARETLAAIANAQVGQPLFSSISPRTLDEIYAEAQQLVQQEKLIEAHALLEELVHASSSTALYHNDLGVLRYQLGDMEGALSSYVKAVALQPEASNFRKNLADLYFTELGLIDDAIAIYLDLFKLSPRDVETLAALGKICTIVGRPEEAKSFYKRALEIEPWNPEIRTALQTI